MERGCFPESIHTLETRTRVWEDLSRPSERVQNVEISDKTQNLSLLDINKEFFQRLQDSWNLEKERFIAIFQAIQNDFGDINEFHKRLWTLSRQIFEHTIVENWPGIKEFLLKTEEFSNCDLEDIEKTYQLSARFPDLTKLPRLLNTNIDFTKIEGETEKKMQSMLEIVLGQKEARTRIVMYQYIHRNQNIRRWWAKTDYVQRIKGNGLNIWEVIAVGETLQFSEADFPPREDPKLRSNTLANVMSVFERKELRVVPWFVSPERAFLKEKFPEFEHRLDVLLNEGRCPSVQDSYTLTLAHKTNRHLTRSVTHECEDILHFYNKGLSAQFMGEMFQYGSGLKKKTKQQWTELVDRFSVLFTEEQRDFVIKFFCSRRQRSQ
ncbi:hypothetical protein O181_125165, partial [Austropuccinia psidii MF-1]|nr:hypothetical protein [Austropuccinia psidii MF-1]